MNRDSNEEALVRVLSHKEEIVPSSGFAASVMDAVREEASAPAPIPFPWKWALPGFAVCIGLIVYALIRLSASSAAVGSRLVVGFPIDRQFSIFAHGWFKAPIGTGIEWSALALLVSLFSVWLSMRLTAGRE